MINDVYIKKNLKFELSFLENATFIKCKDYDTAITYSGAIRLADIDMPLWDSSCLYRFVNEAFSDIFPKTASLKSQVFNDRVKIIIEINNQLFHKFLYTNLLPISDNAWSKELMNELKFLREKVSRQEKELIEMKSLKEQLALTPEKKDTQWENGVSGCFHIYMDAIVNKEGQMFGIDDKGRSQLGSSINDAVSNYMPRRIVVNASYAISPRLPTEKDIINFSEETCIVAFWGAKTLELVNLNGYDCGVFSHIRYKNLTNLVLINCINLKGLELLHQSNIKKIYVCPNTPITNISNEMKKFIRNLK
jgi:hypothetical protein